MKITLIALWVFVVSAQGVQSATSIRVDFQGSGPISFGVVLGVFHNGSFDPFNPGTTVSPALKSLAENNAPLQFLSTAVPAGADRGIIANGSTGAGVSGSSVINVGENNGFFSFSAKLLPSNDWFIGNDTGYDASALLGASPGTMLSFNVLTVWDAGTEREDFAFSVGNLLFDGLIGAVPGGGTAQNGVVSEVTSLNPFSSFANRPEAFNPQSLNFSGNPVARFTLTVIPEPSSAGLLAPVILGFILRRKR